MDGCDVIANRLSYPHRPTGDQPIVRSKIMEAIHKEDEVTQQKRQNKRKGVKSPDDSECANLKLIDRKAKLRLSTLKTEEGIRRAKRGVPPPWYKFYVEKVANILIGAVAIFLLGIALGTGQWFSETYIAGFLTGLLT